MITSLIKQPLIVIYFITAIQCCVYHDSISFYSKVCVSTFTYKKLKPITFYY